MSATTICGRGRFFGKTVEVAHDTWRGLHGTAPTHCVYCKQRMSGV